MCVGASAPPVSADRSFTPSRFTTNDTGSITMIANTLETCPVDAAGQTACSNAQAGAVGATLNNNDWVMRRVDQDGDPATTLDSSSASLSLPAGATVLFAGLYFGAVTTAGTSGQGIANPSLRNTVKLKVPGASSYQTLTAPVLDLSSSSLDGRYQGFVDVTSQVSAAGSGTYSVGDVQEATGKDRYGGWAIVVAYHDATQPLRNLTVFDGLQSVVQGTAGVKIPLDGFLTPPAGQVQTTLGVVAYEGDRGLAGDSLSLNTTKLSDASNPVNNFFNSAISSGGVDVTTKSPNFVNQLGFDAILVNANGVLANNATSATITLQTSSDQYFPGVVTFATDLYSPNVQPTKSVANITHPGGPDQRGDTLRYTVTFTNNGQDGARDFLATDVIPAGTSYVPGSLQILTGPNAGAKSDASGDDQAEFDSVSNKVVFRLGQGATAARGGLVTATGQGGNSTSFAYDVTIGATLPVGTQITNNATAQFLSQTLATPLTATTPDVVTTVAAPDLTLTKSHSPQFVAGGTTTFTLTVPNVGTLPTDGTPVTVTDNVPSGAAGFDSIAIASAPGWACTVAAGTTNLTCTRSDPLAPGASYPSIVFTAVVHNPVSPTIQNTAAVSGGGDSDATNNTATDAGAGVSLADVHVTKTVDQSVVPSGGKVTFDLEVGNTGPSSATAVTLEDALGSNYTDVSVVPSQGTCTTAVHCDLGDLAPNASATIRITATVVATDTTLTNSATVASSTADPVTADNTATASFRVPITSDLNLTKTVTANPAAPFPTAGLADGAIYTITVRNAGPDTANGVRVDDPLPPSFTPSTVSAPGFTCAIEAAAGGTQAVICTRPTLAVADGTLTISITGTFADSAAGTIVPNGARADSSDLDPNPASAADTVSTLVIPAADLQLQKSAPAAVVAPGGTTDFALTLVNNGPSPANATTVTDTLPAGLTFVSASPGCTGAGAAVTCAVGILAAGATTTVTITAQAAVSAAGQTLANSATASTTTPDPDTSNNQAATTVDVATPSADLALSKTASAASIDVGGTLDFTLALHNNGPDPADAAMVTDTLPDGLTFVSASQGCTAAGSTVTCDAGVLTSDQTATFTISASATSAAGQTLTNSATGSSSTPDPDASNNAATAAVAVASPPPPPPPPPAPQSSGQPDLVASKSASSTTVDVGSDVTFLLGVANHGSADATGVTVTDDLAPGLGITTLPNGCTAAGSRVTCSVGTLPAGTSRSFPVTLRPTASLAGRTVTNIATTSGNETDPTPTDDAAQATITVSPLADLDATANVSPAPLPAGKTATYTITIDDKGPSSASGVEATDILPTGLTPILVTPSQGKCTTAGQKITCELGSLPSGGSAQITIDARVDASLAGKTVKDTVTVASAERDPDPANNSATLTSRVGKPARQLDLSVRIAARERVLHTGGVLHFTITAANHSDITATGVRVTATLGLPVQLVSVAVGSPLRQPATAAAACRRALPLVCTLGRLPGLSRLRIRLAVRPLIARPLLTAVSIRADQLETTVRNNRARIRLVVKAAVATVAVEKRAREHEVKAGSTVHYTIVVRPTGSAAALAVHVCDRLPSDQVFASVDGAAFVNGRACWTIPRLAPGTSIRYEIVAIVARSSTSHDSTNTVGVTGSNVTARGAAATVHVIGVPGKPGGAGG